MTKQSRFEWIGRNSSELGVEPAWIVDQAGSALARCIDQAISAENNSEIIVIVAGSNFSSGAGLAAARHLASRDVRVKVLCRPGARVETSIFSDASDAQMQALRRLKHCLEIVDWTDDEELLDSISMLDCPIAGIVVALEDDQWIFRNPQARSRLVNGLNVMSCPVICIASPDGECIHRCSPDLDNPVSHMVFAFRRLSELSERSGETEVAELGIPWEAEWVLGPGNLRPEMFQRPTTARKGDFGQVMVVGGSRGRGPPPFWQV